MVHEGLMRRSEEDDSELTRTVMSAAVWRKDMAVVARFRRGKDGIKPVAAVELCDVESIYGEFNSRSRIECETGEGDDIDE